jgi:hypothetical protein
MLSLYAYGKLGAAYSFERQVPGQLARVPGHSSTMRHEFTVVIGWKTRLKVLANRLVGKKRKSPKTL